MLIKPYLGCNIHCSYCYQRNLRAKDRPKKIYDLPAILKRMEENKNREQITLHGGEILALPKKDVETMLAKIYSLQNYSGIQTNATLIDDDYIAMFKKYKTSVGISWDGPGELSELRHGAKNVEKTIEKLKKEGIATSTIIVLTKANAGTKTRLNKLKKYLLYLNKIQVTGRINACTGAPQNELPMKQLIAVYLDLAQFCLAHGLCWDPFGDIVKALRNEGPVCTFRECDPFSSSSAMVILADGSITNCMRLNSEEILLRDPQVYHTRDEILKNVPQQFGGCKDCPYWVSCHGGCSSNGIHNDWRNRDYLCPLWKALFGYFKKILFVCLDSSVIPATSQPTDIQRSQKDGVSDGKHIHGDSPYGDHTDSSPLRTTINGVIHTDFYRPHGDSHGDHSDSQPPVMNIKEQ